MAEPEHFLCTRSSRRSGESITGTATADTDLWILLEYCGRWAPRVLKGGDVPEEVCAHVSRALAAHPRARFQLIRRPGSPTTGPGSLFVLRSGGRSPGGVRIELGGWGQLCALDLTAAPDRLASEPTAQPVTAPLYLVCTHGKRDRCCARYGPGLFGGLSAAVGERAWQSSHLGGHRFAATAVVFPWGHMYGRLRDEDAVGLAEAHEAGRLYGSQAARGKLAHYRGRTCWDGPTQAAEALLREALGYADVDGVAHLETNPSAEDAWAVRLLLRDQTHTVRVRRTPCAEPVRGSCAKDALSTGYRWERTVDAQ